VATVLFSAMVRAGGHRLAPLKMSEEDSFALLLARADLTPYHAWLLGMGWDNGAALYDAILEFRRDPDSFDKCLEQYPLFPPELKAEHLKMNLLRRNTFAVVVIAPQDVADFEDGEVVQQGRQIGSLFTEHCNYSSSHVIVVVAVTAQEVLVKLDELALISVHNEAQTVVLYFLAGVSETLGLVFADRTCITPTVLGEHCRDINARNVFLEFDFPAARNPDEISAQDFLEKVQAASPALRYSLLDLFTIQPQHLRIHERIETDLLVDVRAAGGLMFIFVCESDCVLCRRFAVPSPFPTRCTRTKSR
jgi:hypothetical protein